MQSASSYGPNAYVERTVQCIHVSKTSHIFFLLYKESGVGRKALTKNDFFDQK